MGPKFNYAQYGFTEAHYKLPDEDNYKPGWYCTKVKPHFPHIKHAPKHEIFDEDLGEWRSSTKLDAICNPDQVVKTTVAPVTEKPTEAPFTLGCKVPDHNGPLAEGWEANRLYRESINLDRRTNPDVADGELDPEEFGVWTDFATCLKNALLLTLGQADYKEVGPAFKGALVNTDTGPVEDDGSKEGSLISGEAVLAGAEIGSSNYAKSYAADLYAKIRGNSEDSRTFHGAGTRYNEEADGSDSVVLECKKYLPKHVEDDPTLHPMAIQVEISFDIY